MEPTLEMVAGVQTGDVLPAIEKLEKSIDDSINNALLELEIDYGSDDTTEQKKLLQFPSDGDQSSAGRRYDRCHH